MTPYEVKLREAAEGRLESQLADMGGDVAQAQAALQGEQIGPAQFRQVSGAVSTLGSLLGLIPGYGQIIKPAADIAAGAIAAGGQFAEEPIWEDEGVTTGLQVGQQVAGGLGKIGRLVKAHYVDPAKERAEAAKMIQGLPYDVSSVYKDLEEEGTGHRLRGGGTVGPAPIPGGRDDGY